MTAYVVIARLSGDSVILDAEYRDQPGAAALLRRWHVGEPGFDEALRRYLGSVQLVAAHTAKEGAVQAGWAGTRDPWFPIDREAVIGHDDKVSQVVGRRFDAVAAARAEIERLPGDRRWAQIPLGKTGEKLDQPAIDPLGRLVLVELKDASNSSAYYAPLQLLQYVCEWAEAWTQIEDHVRALAAARVEVVPSPPGMPALRAGVRPVVAFGRDSRSEEVRRRYDLVVAVVNRHLPRGGAAGGDLEHRERAHSASAMRRTSLHRHPGRARPPASASTVPPSTFPCQSTGGNRSTAARSCGSMSSIPT